MKQHPPILSKFLSPIATSFIGMQICFPTRMQASLEEGFYLFSVTTFSVTRKVMVPGRKEGKKEGRKERRKGGREGRKERREEEGCEGRKKGRERGRRK
jgi:hypothetical protein